MDINRIKYFSVLAEQQHVRKAAEILGINPATLSRAIKFLELEIGFKLIVPSGRGIEITDRGIKLYRQSQALLQGFNDFQMAIQEEDPNTKVIRLGSMEVFTTYFLAKFIEREESDLKLRVHYLTPGKIEDSLKLREVDLGITYIRLPEEGLNYLKIGEFQMKVFGQKSMGLKKFEDLPFAVPITGINTPTVSLRSLDGWPCEEFPRQVKYELELLETALQFARLGRAVVYCPDFIVKFQNECLPQTLRLHEITPPAGFKPKTLPIYLVRRKNEEETPFIRRLAKLARSLR
ncbi:MAG: LysR family transcriptional regulator [Bacteriovorax sp.]